MFEGGSEEDDEDEDGGLDRDVSDNENMTSHRINHNVDTLRRNSP